jgi:rubredoxin
MGENETKFEEIEEDFQGRDLLTFKCPDCKTSQKSYRVGK